MKITIAIPFPSFPRTFSSGTKQFSKTSSHLPPESHFVSKSKGKGLGMEYTDEISHKTCIHTYHFLASQVCPISGQY